LAAAHAAAMNAGWAQPGKVDDLDERRRRHGEAKADEQARRLYAEARSDLAVKIGERAVQELETLPGLPMFEPRTALTDASA
jgi:hypothetical protein